MKKRFLITVLRFHGDVLLAKPIIDNIKLNYPDSIIDLLVYKGTEAILKHDMQISNIITLSSTSKTNSTSYVKGFKALQSFFTDILLWIRIAFTNYNFGIFLTTQWRVLPISWAMVRATKVAVSDKKRRGPLWANSFNTLLPETDDTHIVERNLSSLKQLGLKIFSSELKLLNSISEAKKNKCLNVLQEWQIKDKYCVIHATSRRESKLWKIDNYQPLIEALQKRGLKVVLVSGPEKEEIEYINSIEKNSTNEIINLSGKTSLLTLAFLVSKSSLFIGLDSVASHIAASVNTPSITLFGPSNASNWKPWSTSSLIITRKEEELCKEHGHLGGKFARCLCYITPERVVGLVDRILEN
tara:strand:- start:2770 stop:3837 length:1068 start_codon:yes stop_codon:yes gene_type:complete